MLELRAGDVRGIVDPGHGGRLSSLVIGGVERLRGPRRLDGQPWDRPIDWGLFLMAPWVGRLDGGRLPTGQGLLQVPRDHGNHAIHGTVHSRRWDVDRHDDAAAVELSTGLGDAWPLGGSVSQSYELHSDHLWLRAVVTAGGAPMPAALGWHPWLRVSDEHSTSVALDAAGTLGMRDDLVRTGVMEALTDTTRLDGRPLAGRRLDHTYVGPADHARVALPDLDLRLDWSETVTAVTVHTPGDAICVEPLTAWPNAAVLAADGVEGTGLARLEPGGSLAAETRLHWA